MLQLTTPQSSIDLTSLQGVALHQIVTKQIPVNIALGSPSSPDLFAIYSKSTIDELLDVKGCVGIRFYPAIKEDELVLIATCVDDLNNDMNELNGGKCACGYSNPLVESHDSSISDSKNMILATDHPGSSNLDDLHFLQFVETDSTDTQKFKAYFDQEFFKSNFGDAPSVRLDVAELNFSGDNEIIRTIAATFLNGSPTPTTASLLPCPPNCGGDYTTDELV